MPYENYSPSGLPGQPDSRFGYGTESSRKRRRLWRGLGAFAFVVVGAVIVGNRAAQPDGPSVIDNGTSQLATVSCGDGAEFDDGDIDVHVAECSARSVRVVMTESGTGEQPDVAELETDGAFGTTETQTGRLLVVRRMNDGSVSLELMASPSD